MKRTPLRRKTRLRPISTRRSQGLRLYAIARREYLTEHPICEVCKSKPSTEIHHKKGRLGPLLWDKRFFLATDWWCHKRIEREREWAMTMGYRLNRL